VPYFGTFLPNAVAFKNVKNYLRKNSSALAPKMLVKLLTWWQKLAENLIN
jgi:hypothetical protein